MELIKTTEVRRSDTNRDGSKITGFKLGDTYIEGLDELIAQFLALPDDMTSSLEKPSTECAEIIAAKARTKVHNIEQDLVNGITVKGPGRGDKYHHRKYRTFATVSLGKDAMHGVPVELGHRFSGYLWKQADSKRVPEHPFLRPAADESREQVAKILTDAMNDVIKKVGGNL